MPSVPYPEYVDRGGLGVYPQPVEGPGSELYVFLLRGQLDNLEKLCRTYLTDPSGGRVQYQPVVPYLMLTVATMPALRSGVEPYGARGTLLEREATFWMLVSDSRGDLSWFVPYIIVDNPVALSAGREIYGLPKQYGRLQLPASPSGLDRILVDVMSFREYAPGAEAGLNPLLAMTRTPHRILDELAEIAKGVEAGFEFLLKQLTHDLDHLGQELTTLIDNVRSLFNKGLPAARIVMLKQFRDIEDGTRACYQAIVETTATVGDSHFRLVPSLDLEIGQLQSHPLCEDLGLERQSRTLPGLWVKTDMVLGTGREVWRWEP